MHIEESFDNKLLGKVNLPLLWPGGTIIGPKIGGSLIYSYKGFEIGE